MRYADRRWGRSRIKGLLLMALLLGGCQTFESDPVTLIKEMRLIAVKAQPAFIAGPGQTKAPVGTPTTLTPLVINRTGKDSGKLCFAWRLCPFAWERDGQYKCISDKLEIDLGTDPTAKVTALDVFASLEKFEEVAQELGLADQLGGGGGGGAQQQQQESATGLEATILFMIGKPEVWGGSCPADSATMLHKVCPTRDGCVQGYTKLTVATKDNQANATPMLDDFTFEGVTWPESVTPVVGPISENDDGSDDLSQSGRQRGYLMGPVFDKSAMEVIKPATADQPEVAETLSFSWFSDNGVFKYSKTSDRVFNNRYRPTKPGEDHADETGKTKVTTSVWMVARDSRNGVNWVHRKVIVDKDAPKDGHPLCRVDNTLKGCDEVTK